MARFRLGRQGLVWLGIALLVLAALDLAVMFTNSGFAVRALVYIVGLLFGLGVAVLVGRLAGSRRRAVISLVALAVVGFVAYAFALRWEGMGDGARGYAIDGDRVNTLFLGLLLGSATGVRNVFRRQPSPEEIREQRELRRKSRPVVIAICGLVLLLTAAVIVDNFV